MLIYIICSKIAVSSHFFISALCVLDLFMPILTFIYSLTLSLPRLQKRQTPQIYTFVYLFLTIILIPFFLLPLFSMEEELPSNKKRGFCKCFSPLKRELPGKSLLLTFLPPKEHHGMFFCHILIKKQQGQASL